MVHLGSWHSVCTLKALVANGRQLHIGSLFSNFDTLELSIVEVVSIIDIPDLSWVHRVLKLSMVLLVECSLLFSSVLDPSRLLNTRLKIRIDSLGRGFGETISEQVFTCNLGDETGVAWNMLSLEVVSWSSYPGLPLLRVVPELLILTIKSD